MSRRNAAILDDESGKGLGKVKKCSKGEDDKVTFVVVRRPLIPTPLSFQNGGIVLETEFFCKRWPSQKHCSADYQNRAPTLEETGLACSVSQLYGYGLKYFGRYFENKRVRTR